MLNALLGTLCLAGAFVVAQIMIAFVRRMRSLIVVEARTQHMESGRYIEHCMVFNHDTGLAVARKKPSTAAFRDLS